MVRFKDRVDWKGMSIFVLAIVLAVVALFTVTKPPQRVNLECRPPSCYIYQQDRTASQPRHRSLDI